MYGIYTYLCFFCLFALSIEQWSQPISIVKDSYKGQDIHITKERKKFIIYVFYTSTTETNTSVVSSMCYKAYGVDMSFIKEKCIRQKLRLYGEIQATGSDDGQYLYVVFSARRTLRGTNCDSTGDDGCLDIYFTESKDAGATWSTPSAVPRDNMADRIHRVGPTILFVKERIFIFYNDLRYSNVRQIDFVTRPPNSLVFTDQKVIEDTWHMSDLSMRSGYTIKGESIFVYYFCLSGGGVMFGGYTSTNGATWKKYGEFIKDNCEDCRYDLQPSLKKDALFLAVVNPKFYKVFLAESEKLESRAITLDLNAEGYWPVIGDISENEKHLLLIGNKKSMNLTTFDYGIEFEDLVDLKSIPPLKIYQGAKVYSNTTHFTTFAIHAVGNNLSMSTFTLKKGQRID